MSLEDNLSTLQNKFQNGIANDTLSSVDRLLQERADEIKKRNDITDEYGVAVSKWLEVYSKTGTLDDGVLKHSRVESEVIVDNVQLPFTPVIPVQVTQKEQQIYRPIASGNPQILDLMPEQPVTNATNVIDLEHSYVEIVLNISIIANGPMDLSQPGVVANLWTYAPRQYGAYGAWSKCNMSIGQGTGIKTAITNVDWGLSKMIFAANNGQCRHGAKNAINGDIGLWGNDALYDPSCYWTSYSNQEVFKFWNTYHTGTDQFASWQSNTEISLPAFNFHDPAYSSSTLPLSNFMVFPTNQTTVPMRFRLKDLIDWDTNYLPASANPTIHMELSQFALERMFIVRKLNKNLVNQTLPTLPTESVYQLATDFPGWAACVNSVEIDYNQTYMCLSYDVLSPKVFDALNERFASGTVAYLPRELQIYKLAPLRTGRTVETIDIMTTVSIYDLPRRALYGHIPNYGSNLSAVVQWELQGCPFTQDLTNSYNPSANIPETIPQTKIIDGFLNNDQRKIVSYWRDMIFMQPKSFQRQWTDLSNIVRQQFETFKDEYNYTSTNRINDIPLRVWWDRFQLDRHVKQVRPISIDFFKIASMGYHTWIPVPINGPTYPLSLFQTTFLAQGESVLQISYSKPLPDYVTTSYVPLLICEFENPVGVQDNTWFPIGTLKKDQNIEVNPINLVGNNVRA